MNGKENFLKAVQLLAPGDPFIVKAAAEVPQESLPGLQRQKAAALACRSRFKSPGSGKGPVVRIEIDSSDMPLECALRVKSAEFWLKLGNPTQALKEIQNLPERMQKRPWPLKVHLAAIGAIRQSTHGQA
jgi:hypothetical protein